MKERRLPINVVLIADKIDNFQNIDISSNNLELIEEDYFNEISTALQSMCRRVYFYESPKDFLGNIRKHKKDVIFSIWSGKASKNRRALIPSICEAYGIPYIGSDTYTNILCQDKAMTKDFCKKIGINTPEYVLYNERTDPKIIKTLRLPVVVKPNFEGGSIGIASTNLIQDYEAATILCRNLYSIYKQNIMVEEFIPGREISLILFGSKGQLKLLEAMEIVVEGEGNSLINRLYSYEIKKSHLLISKNIRVTDSLPQEIFDDARKIFKLLDKVETLRIDGRFDGHHFHLIELTPDIHYGANCTFAGAFLAKGISYNAMIRMIILNTLEADPAFAIQS
jgi:D-alanine-D-alanine ligase